MILSSTSEKPVGVIGAGNFGTVIANILAHSRKVLLYTRDEQTAVRIKSENQNKGYPL
ncbi:MAG TPA: glycerol 3-phosphate dehydrogenase, partial [Cyclobacteriaceae bacterium]|nr:glycerol 3-phosphate dehydrogenase [Cyclobacteriaceae bacterium]